MGEAAVTSWMHGLPPHSTTVQSTPTTDRGGGGGRENSWIGEEVDDDGSRSEAGAWEGTREH